MEHIKVKLSDDREWLTRTSKEDDNTAVSVGGLACKLGIPAENRSGHKSCVLKAGRAPSSSEDANDG
jgi:hypothetical protein